MKQKIKNKHGIYIQTVGNPQEPHARGQASLNHWMNSTSPGRRSAEATERSHCCSCSQRGEQRNREVSLSHRHCSQEWAQLAWDEVALCCVGFGGQGHRIPEMGTAAPLSCSGTHSHTANLPFQLQTHGKTTGSHIPWPFRFCKWHREKEKKNFFI